MLRTVVLVNHPLPANKYWPLTARGTELSLLCLDLIVSRPMTILPRPGGVEIETGEDFGPAGQRTREPDLCQANLMDSTSIVLLIWIVLQ